MGTSLGQILFTLAAVYGVWTFFGILKRRAQGRPRSSPADAAARAARDAVRARVGPAKTPQPDTPRHAPGDRDPPDRGGPKGAPAGWGAEGDARDAPAQPLALDLVRCPGCGAYTTRGGPCPCGWTDSA